MPLLYFALGRFAPMLIRDVFPNYEFKNEDGKNENFRRPITIQIQGKITFLCQIRLFDYKDKVTDNLITIDEDDKKLVKNNKWYYKDGIITNENGVSLKQLFLNTENIELLEEKT
ncbi:14696_t:CDS:2, partial [Dentiscutata erythropus]